MPVRRLLVTVAAALATAVVLVSPAGAADPRAHTPELQFLGQAIVPTGTTFAGTPVGGLSSITYDSARGLFYSLSDDQSQFAPARFYTLTLDVSHDSLANGDEAWLVTPVSARRCQSA